MGLLISILVVCVGVAELLSVLTNFRVHQANSLNSSSSSDLCSLIERYDRLYEISLLRRREEILKIIEENRRKVVVTDSLPFANESCHETIIDGDDDGEFITTEDSSDDDTLSFDRSDHSSNKTQSSTPKCKSRPARKCKKRPKSRANFAVESRICKLRSHHRQIQNFSPKHDSCLIFDPKFKSISVQTVQIADLNKQIVAQDYWTRSPSPFGEFIDANANLQEHAGNVKKILLDTASERCPSAVVSDVLLENATKPDFDISRIKSGDASSRPLNNNYLENLSDLRGLSSEENNTIFDANNGADAANNDPAKLKSLTAASSKGQQVLFSTLDVSKNEAKNFEHDESSNTIVLEEAPYDGERNAAENAFWLIFSGEYTKAMNKDWHGQHFCCWQCDESLTGQRYVLRDDHPYCVSCYESVFANNCEKCSKTIGIDSKDLSYKDKHWHEACFLCTTCGNSLVDKQFGSKGDRIYCGGCYDEQFASRCDGCGQIFRAGTKKMEYKTRQWHEKCFCCCVCKSPIGTQSFIPREQEIYCAKCYEEKYATRCIKCNKVITSGGVTYKNEPWHRECFTCTNCNTSLAGARFTSRDDKPYCAECFGELFAKRCTACNKPITGIGGTKFISFEDRHWHNDCFFCASCRTTLVGRGFITDGDDIICPECAKQKLM